jgi:hypothetical protein
MSALSRTILLIAICLAAASSARAHATSGLTVDDAEVSWDLDEALFAKKGISLAACSVPEPAPPATLKAMVACWVSSVGCLGDARHAAASLRRALAARVRGARVSRVF